VTIHQKFAAARTRVNHRLFFALLPPPEIAARVGRLRDGLGAAKAGVRDDRLHITSLIFDDLPFPPPRQLLEAMMEAAGSLKAAPPEIVLDKLISNGRTSCLVPGKPLPLLNAFHTELFDALAKRGLPPRRGWRFSPHMTLLYDPQIRRSGAIAPIRWEATEFVLIDSLLGQTRHIILDRWPLVHQPRLL